MEYNDEGLLVDRLLPTLVHCCSRASAELLGIVKLPLVLLLVFLGQVRDETQAMRGDHPPGAEDGDQQPAPPRLGPPAQTPPRLSPQPSALTNLLPPVQPVQDGSSNSQPLLSNLGQSALEICSN